MNDRASRMEQPQSESDRHLARRYMLGTLSAEERDQLEQRYIFDPSFEELVLAEETDLFDALAAGELSAEDNRAVRQWASKQERTQTKLAAAFALNRLSPDNVALGSMATSGNAKKHWWLDGIRAPRFSALALAGVLAACLALVTVVGWFARTRLNSSSSASIKPDEANRSPIAGVPTAQTSITNASVPQSTQTPIREAVPSPPSVASATANPAAILTMLLMAEETRGSASIPDLQMKPTTETVKLQLATQSGLTSGQYTAEITGPESLHFKKIGDLSPRHLHGEAYIELQLHAAALRPGAYRITLHRRGASAESPDLEYRFEIPGPGAE